VECPTNADSIDFPAISPKALIEQGLHSLIKRNSVVQIAPTGHVFKHPSGRTSKVFIQTREFATTEPELGFIGRTISYAFTQVKTDDLAIVYIDSMGIYPYVREALTVLNSTARIHSFHSYDEVKKLLPPSEPHLVIISASTTGGMARDLKNDQKFDSARLLTIIDMSDSDRSGAVLVALDKVDDKFAQLISDGSDGNETEVELVGEHFASKAKPPRAVTLGMPHTPKQLTKVLKHFGIEGMQQINTKPNHTDNPKIVCIDPTRLDGNASFAAWLKMEIEWNIPLTVDCIIYAEDNAKNVAEQARAVIQAAKGTLPTVIHHADLSRENLKDTRGLLVVTAVAGDGGLLRQISRDLREYVATEIPRHYLVGIALPQTEEAWLHLSQFLVRNATDRKYGFSSWITLPVGSDTPSNAWLDINNLSSRAQLPDMVIKSENVASETVEASLRMMSEVVRTSWNGFLPKPNNTQLDLTEGFIYFGDVFKTNLNRVRPPDAYLAVTSALQAARELKDVANRLKPTGYESVVLAPECFLRFNENLLQACLLRACHQSELDYSASPQYSKLMKEFLIKVFDRRDSHYGAAALEFAAALATGRLKLKATDKEAVVGHVIEQIKSQPSALLGFLLMANHKLRIASVK
jgi:hypothetical protein